MAGSPWLIVGLSGVTCGGKTSLAAELNKLFPRSRVLNQDEYFLPVTDPRHTKVKDLNAINFELLTSLDMEKMLEDIKAIVGDRLVPNINRKKYLAEFCAATMSRAELQRLANQKMKTSPMNILIVEGFSVFNYKPIEELCDLKYYFTLTKEECYKRRLTRVYEPPDCEGYFEAAVWPEHLKQLKYVEEHVPCVKWFGPKVEDALCEVLCDLVQIL